MSDLIGYFGEDELLELWDADTATAKALLDDLRNKADISVIQEFETRLKQRVEEPAGLLFPPKHDPSLPEIILLHGVTDAHLANVAGRRNRIWLSYIELIKGRFSKCLTVQPDGVSDQPDVRLETDGPVWRKYRKAIDSWQRSGFRCQVYCYDWRKSVSQAADLLDSFLMGLDTIKSGRKVILVCHSMGGLVASTYAARHPRWSKVIEHAVLVGSPLGGAYSAAIAILGKSVSFQKMDRLSIFESLADLQWMAASFPGLVDLLPNPDEFPQAADLYTASGWPGRVKPSQSLLDQSLALKRTVWTSPLFTISTHLISQDYPTIAELPWNDDHSDREPSVMSSEGDGSVLSRSSLVPGLTAFKIPGEHSLLCTESQVIQAVEAIAKGRTPNLPMISRSDLNGHTFHESSPAVAALAAMTSFAAPTQSLLEEAVETALLSRFTSDGTLGALRQLSGNTGSHSFSRSDLRSNDFSWQNALSLAIASEFAYQKDVSILKSIAKQEWGFRDCQAFDVKTTQGFVTWDDDVVILSFRGTERNLADWLGNLKVAGKNSQGYGVLHGGFYTAFQDAQTTVDRLLAGAMSSKKKLWITGHSLGGALAVIATAEYQAKYSVAGVYTYGQPKVGANDLAEYFEQKLPDRYVRFVNHEDVVPLVPPGYQHFGRLVWFNAQGVYVDRANMLALPSVSPEPNELTPVQFAVMQERLKELQEPSHPGALCLPPSEAEMESQALFGLSIGDHSIREAYIPIIAKQF